MYDMYVYICIYTYIYIHMYNVCHLGIMWHKPNLEMPTGRQLELQQLQQLGQLPELCHLSIPDLHLASHPAPGGT